MNKLTSNMKRTEIAAPANIIQSMLVEAAQRISLWHNRSRQRHTLSTLTDDQLWDIGLSAQEAKSEFNKRFWQ